MSLESNIKKGRLSASYTRPYITNAPAGTEAATEYFSNDTKAFYSKYLQWSSNMYDIEVQGIRAEEWYEYTTARVRVSDVISPTTGDYLNDDWAWILFEDPGITFVPIGAKVKYNNSTWLVVNPDNVSAESGSAIIRRCNAVYHDLDWYGNVIAEPMIFDRGKALGTADYYDEEMVLMTAYAHCFMQRNPNTANIRHNTRMLLGHQAYAVRGLVDFIQEFTGDDNTVHMLRFDLGITEPNRNDDFTTHVAEGKSFSWTILPQLPETLQENGSIALSAKSIRCGEEVANTQEHPIFYRWTSSDPSVASVDNTTGVVTGVSEGWCEISCMLRQNHDLTATWGIRVVQDSGEEYISFTSQPPESIPQFSSVTFVAARFQGGEMLPGPVSFRLEDADRNSYGYMTEELDEGTAITITCYAPSERPLAVYAYSENAEIVTKIRLEGM